IARDGDGDAKSGFTARLAGAMGILRLFLALSVVISHVGGTVLGVAFLPPQLAVVLFFIVSGFYMSLILNEKYCKLPNATRRFYLNRFLLIYPIYFVVCVLVVLLLRYTRSNDVFFHPAPDTYGIDRFFFMMLNIFIVGQDYVSSFSWGYFHREDNHLIPPAW